MYQLQLKNGSARRGSFQTVHGTVQTPAFMNVGTAAAIKGGISSYDLKEIKCQVELCNTCLLYTSIIAQPANHFKLSPVLFKGIGGIRTVQVWLVLKILSPYIAVSSPVEAVNIRLIHTADIPVSYTHLVFINL